MGRSSLGAVDGFIHGASRMASQCFGGAPRVLSLLEAFATVMCLGGVPRAAGKLGKGTCAAAAPHIRRLFDCEGHHCQKPILHKSP